jgi:hypothetical protein
VQDASWQGNFIPVYWFAGYAYAPGIIPIGLEPWHQYAVVGNCATPPEAFDITCLGGMGIFTEGVECCPEGGPSQSEGSTWGTIKHLYR